MQIIHTENLLEAVITIAFKAENEQDRIDWGNISRLINQDTPEAYEQAAAAFRLMDTASRDLLTNYARYDSRVKHEAEAALSIQWRF